jgi:type I restriction enzyme S subunit
VLFGDVVRQCKEKADPETSGLERYVAGDHMDTDDLRLRRWGRIGSGYLGPAFHIRFKPGQVLYGSRRTYLRKVAVADFEGICANTTFVLEPKSAEELLPEFSVKNSKGSVNPYINFSDLANFEFILPPIEEQCQLIRLLGNAENAKSAMEDAVIQAERMRKSLLFATFDALQGNTSARIPFFDTQVSCRWVKVRDAGEILMGRQLSPKYKTGNNPRKYLRVANVFDGFIDTSDVHEMDFSEKEFVTYKLQTGDVLLNEGQSRELVGRSAIYENDISDCCFQNTLIRFRPKAEVMSEFAHYYFQYCQYTSRFIRISKQTTSIAHLGVQRFAEMNFPVVSVNAQKAIVDVLSSVVEATRQLKSRAQAASSIKKLALRDVF